MKRLHWLALCMMIVLVVLANPVSAAIKSHTLAQKSVTASAVIVPAQVSDLGFMIPGIAGDVPVKEGDVVKAGQTLMVLDTPELQFAVTESEARVRGAQAQLEIKQREVIKKYEINYRTFTIKKLRLSVPGEVIEIANANIQEAQAAVEIAQARLAQGTLLAPHDGVVASVDILPGEYVSANKAVVTLATLDNWQIETTDLSERDITHVHIGDAVTISVAALDQTFTGKVIRISPIADTVGGDVVFKVTIAFVEQPDGLRWGMTAEVNIQGGE